MERLRWHKKAANHCSAGATWRTQMQPEGALPEPEDNAAQISPRNGRHAVKTRAALESFPARERRTFSETTLDAKMSDTMRCISKTASDCSSAMPPSLVMRSRHPIQTMDWPYCPFLKDKSKLMQRQASSTSAFQRRLCAALPVNVKAGSST